MTDKAEYLSAGIHIGMKSCSKYMKKFVYKTREDGLSVFNLEEVDNRIAIAAKFLANFKKIMVVSHKAIGDQAARKLSEVIGGKAAIGRFSPGTLTNPSYRDFYEPDIVLVTDPLIDAQAVVEAKKRRVPIVALCDTPHEGTDVDLIIPVNNNGKKALALTLWILSKEVLKSKGNLKKDSDFKFTLKDFGDEVIKKAKPQDEEFEGDISVEIENIENPKEEKKAKKTAKKKELKEKPTKTAEPKVEKVEATQEVHEEKDGAKPKEAQEENKAEAQPEKM